jgi:hypothetical protein
MRQIATLFLMAFSPRQQKLYNTRVLEILQFHPYSLVRMLASKYIFVDKFDKYFAI